MSRSTTRRPVHPTMRTRTWARAMSCRPRHRTPIGTWTVDFRRSRTAPDADVHGDSAHGQGDNDGAGDGAVLRAAQMGAVPRTAYGLCSIAELENMFVLSPPGVPRENVGIRAARQAVWASKLLDVFSRASTRAPRHTTIYGRPGLVGAALGKRAYTLLKARLDGAAPGRASSAGVRAVPRRKLDAERASYAAEV
jgi:hypothetical protein